MNSILFDQACDEVIYNPKTDTKIGTLGEKTIHAVLKKYLWNDIKCHEIKIDNFFADIVCEKGIIEIQSQNFDKLRKKLEVFLEISPVTIVYPIPYIRYLRWVNEQTGEISSPRKSTKTGNLYSVLPEIYKIKNYINHPNLSIQLIFINVEEYRLLDGWSTDKKKGATKCDKIPLKLVDELIINTPLDYDKFIPKDLGETFTAKEFQKATKLYGRNTWYAINLLNFVGAIKQVGKNGRAYLYSR